MLESDNNCLQTNKNGKCLQIPKSTYQSRYRIYVSMSQNEITKQIQCVSDDKGWKEIRKKTSL